MSQTSRMQNIAVSPVPCRLSGESVFLGMPRFPGRCVSSAGCSVCDSDTENSYVLVTCSDAAAVVAHAKFFQSVT